MELITITLTTWFVEEVRNNCETMDKEPAVDKAIKDMPKDYEIKEFLVAHQSEVKDMCLTEYDEAETMEMFKEEGREEGREEERANTERERKRAEAAERRVAELEKLLATK